MWRKLLESVNELETIWTKTKGIYVQAVLCGKGISKWSCEDSNVVVMKLKDFMTI